MHGVRTARREERNIVVSKYHEPIRHPPVAKSVHGCQPQPQVDIVEDGEILRESSEMEEEASPNQEVRGTQAWVLAKEVRRAQVDRRGFLALDPRASAHQKRGADSIRVQRFRRVTRTFQIGGQPPVIVVQKG